MKLNAKLIIPAILLAATLATGVYATVMFTVSTTVTVTEPLTVTPTSLSFTLFAGESGHRDITIMNAGSVAIPVTVAASLTSCTVSSSEPLGTACAVGDVPLSCSGLSSSPSCSGTATVPAATATGPGSITITVTATASTSAAAGTYTGSASVTR